MGFDIHMHAVGASRRRQLTQHLFHRQQLIVPAYVGAKAIDRQPARVSRFEIARRHPQLFAANGRTGLNHPR